MSDFEFTGIFNDITPQDFELPAAIQERRLSPGTNQTFDDFVDEQLRTLKLAFETSHGRIDPYAVIANASVERTIMPTDSETLAEWVDRVRHEARTMDARLVFINRLTPVMHRTVDRKDLVDINDPEEVERSRKEMRDGLFWYAECGEQGTKQQRGYGRARHRFGFMMPDENAAITTLVEGPSDQPVPIFSNILD